MADLDRFDSALSTMERSKVPLTASVLRGVLLSAALTGKPGQCRSLLSPPQLMRQHRVLITAWSRQAQGLAMDAAGQLSCSQKRCSVEGSSACQCFPLPTLEALSLAILSKVCIRGRILLCCAEWALVCCRAGHQSWPQLAKPT